MQRKGFSVKESLTQVKKNLDTGDYTLPSYFLPELFIVQPQQTPVADMIPRETVQRKTVYAQYQSEEPSVSWGLENTSDGGVHNYSRSDATYSENSYDVYGYGLSTIVEDKMILAQQTLRSAESQTQRAQMIAMRQSEEKQILFGTSGYNGDGSGFSGFADKGTKYTSISTGSGTDYLTKIRELIDEVEYQGGTRENIVVITDFETHQYLRNDLDDFTRYQMLDEDELGFGFSALEIDGVPVWKSHGIDKQSSLSSNNEFIFAVNMDSTYMGMLQDVTMKPLAKQGPYEEIATDAYGACVMEAPSHIQYIEKS